MSMVTTPPTPTLDSLCWTISELSRERTKLVKEILRLEARCRELEGIVAKVTIHADDTTVG